MFHQMSKHLQSEPEQQPGEWEMIDYKLYPRLPKIELEGGSFEGGVFDLIKRRQSRRDFKRESITKQELALLLKYSCGSIDEKSEGHNQRAQPSSGRRFPIEVYPIVFRSGNDLKAGLYHYNVKDHALDVLWDREFSNEDISQIFTFPWVRDAAVGIVITAIFWRNQNKYGERGYRYILLEAGHIGQNLYLISEALGIKCCALGGTLDKNLEKLVDIDGVMESVVYALAVGR